MSTAGEKAEQAAVPKYVTIPEFAAMCREKCTRPAQGYDDGTPCGSERINEDGERVHSFCGHHWGNVVL